MRIVGGGLSQPLPIEASHLGALGTVSGRAGGGGLPLKCQLLTVGLAQLPPSWEGKGRRGEGAAPFPGRTQLGGCVSLEGSRLWLGCVRREPGMRLPPVCDAVCGPHLVG